MKKWPLLFLLVLSTSTISAAEPSTLGAALYKQCSGCHGADGQNKAFGKSNIIAGQPAEDLMESLSFYQESDFKTHSSTTVMAKQVKNLSDKELTELTQFISKLKK